MLKFYQSITIVALSAWSALAQSDLILIQDSPDGLQSSSVQAVSFDGSVAVGDAIDPSGNVVAFRWTKPTGMVDLGDLPAGSTDSFATDVSADGSVIVGYVHTGTIHEAFRWTEETGIVKLGTLPGGGAFSQAMGVSADGNTIVGYAINADGNNEAFKWTQQTGMVGLGDLPGGDFYSAAYNISADGSTIVGESKNDRGGEAFRWTEIDGLQGIGVIDDTDPYGSVALDVSGDGSVIVGRSHSVRTHSQYFWEAFIWTEDNGMSIIGPTSAPITSIAYSISNNGRVIVGVSNPGIATIWKPTDYAYEYIEDVLIDHGLDESELQNVNLQYTYATSNDGRVVGGYAIVVENGDPRSYAYIASYYCPGDFNRDGHINSLDVISYLSAWVIEDPSADVNQDDRVDTTDFLAFLNQWNQRCQTE